MRSRQRIVADGLISQDGKGRNRAEVSRNPEESYIFYVKLC